MSEADESDRRVPVSWRVTGGLAWRFVVIVVALGVLGYIVGYLALVVVPVAVALLLAALLNPVVERLVKWRIPRALSVVTAVVGGLIVIAGVLTGVVTAVIANLPKLRTQLGESIKHVNNWLAQGPLHMSSHALQDLLDRVTSAAESNERTLVFGAASTLSTAAEVLTAIGLTIFTLIFFLKDGDAVWRVTTRAAPREVRSRVDSAGRAAFRGLISYVRATILVAAGDAIGIGIGLFAIGVPLALPLAALVFLGAFIPIAGSVVAGLVTVLVTLVTNGLISALVMLAVVVAVMQLEGNVLQPLLLGRAIRLHPLAIVLAIAGGTVVAGVAGALLSVPLLTVLNSAFRYLTGESNGSSTTSGSASHEPLPSSDPGPEDSNGDSQGV